MTETNLATDYDWTPPPRRTADVIDLDAHRGLDVAFDVGEPTPVVRIPSTDQTRARFAFLKTKKLGATWEESGRLYRMGPSGVTVFKRECFG